MKYRKLGKFRTWKILTESYLGILEVDLWGWGGEWGDLLGNVPRAQKGGGRGEERPGKELSRQQC